MIFVFIQRCTLLCFVFVHRSHFFMTQRYDNELEDEEEVEEEAENWNNRVECVQHSSEASSEESDSEWENEAPQNKRSRRVYTYSLPFEQHSGSLQAELKEFNAFLTLPIVLKR